MLSDMSYASLSAVVVLVIIALGIVVWLPARTANSMRHVEEHRADRFSPSMHLVDESSGTRFSDGHTPVKGILMQPQERRGTAWSAERIDHVRAERRAAVRRRQIIVLSLLVVTLVVLGLAFGLKFSPLFALIPAALLVLVLALGAHAAAQARAWERKVARMRKTERERAAAARAAVRTAVNIAEQTAADDTAAATETMEKREIRRVLHEAELERARREQLKAEAAAHDAASQTAAPRTAAPQAAAPAGSSASSGQSAAPAAQTTADAATGTASQASSDLVPTDLTAEVSEVKPARAIEAFDMVASQDLISFSLGAPRNGVETPAEAPESLEIRSARQVSRAEPVDADTEARLAAEARMETEPAASPRNAAAFHDAEEHAEVEAPAASDDSLGHGLESILARRGNGTDGAA